MTSQLTSSVVIATLNGQKYIQRQLLSICQQVRPPDEIIVVDDGSSDATVALINELAAKNCIEFRVYLNESNMGYVGAFSRAIHKASADIVFFCDQDDVWMPDKIERVMQAFEHNERVDCIRHDLRIVDKEGCQLSSSYFSLLCRQGRDPSFLTKGCALAFRRTLLDKVMPPPATNEWAHDDWPVLICQILGRVENIPNVLVDHRIHGENASGRVPRRNVAAFVEGVCQRLLFGARRPSVLAHKSEEALAALRHAISSHELMNTGCAESIDNHLILASMRREWARSGLFVRAWRIGSFVKSNEASHLAGFVLLMRDLVAPKAMPQGRERV